MRRAVVAALVLVGALPACGLARTVEVDLSRVTLVRYHADPTVPPPYHTEWKLLVTPDRNAVFTIWHGYPNNPGVTSAVTRFTLSAARYDTLMAAFGRAEFTPAERMTAPIAPGSPVDSVYIEAPAHEFDVVTGAAPIFQAFDACVPPH